MENQATIIGVEDHVRTILGVMDRLISIVEAENHLLRQLGPAYRLHTQMQENKLRLYRRFETLALIVKRVMQSGLVEDRELFRSLIPRVAQVKQLSAENSLLLMSRFQYHQHLLSSIMYRIEGQSNVVVANDDGSARQCP